jgi:hypothetical protein
MVAPIVLAKETISVPVKKPKRAPPTIVRTTAPGRDKEVATTYMKK